MVRESKYWKTTITVEVLSVGKNPPDFKDLSEVDYEIVAGDCSGHIGLEDNQELDLEEFLEECEKHGTDPEFFGLYWRDM